MNIDLYTDGSATTVDKPGGWGWVMVIDGVDHSENAGYMPNASNNDAELEAAIQGLTYIRNYLNNYVPVVPSSVKVTLVSDSQLVLGWTNGTYAFRQKDKLEKFKTLQLLVSLMNVKTRWVEGHTGDVRNERCDKLANMARKQELMSMPADFIPSKKETKAYTTNDTITLTMRIKTNRKSINDYVHTSIQWANGGPYARGSDYWATMFVDKLEELLENNKIFSIEKE